MNLLRGGSLQAHMDKLRRVCSGVRLLHLHCMRVGLGCLLTLILGGAAQPALVLGCSDAGAATGDKRGASTEAGAVLHGPRGAIRAAAPAAARPLGSQEAGPRLTALQQHHAWHA